MPVLKAVEIPFAEFGHAAQAVWLLVLSRTLPRQGSRWLR
jgi:hypothetical protein